jgi:hypothetical protein
MIFHNRANARSRIFAKDERSGETMAKIRHISYRAEDVDAMAKFLIDAMGMTMIQKRKDGSIDLSAISSCCWLGDVEGMVHCAGQSVGLIKDIQPAARIVQRLKQETKQFVGHWQ